MTLIQSYVFVKSRLQVLREILKKHNQLSGVHVWIFKELQNLVGFARVQHLPASIQVEFLFISLEIVRVLRGLRIEHLLSFVNTSTIKKGLNLILCVYLFKHNHSGLVRALRFFSICCKEYHLVRDWIDRRLYEFELQSLVIGRIQLVRTKLLQEFSTWLEYHYWSLVNSNNIFCNQVDAH